MKCINLPIYFNCKTAKISNRTSIKTVIDNIRSEKFNSNKQFNISDQNTSINLISGRTVDRVFEIL
jgi:hypothetical protein